MKFNAIYIEASIDSILANALFADPETNPDEPSVLSFSRTVEFEDSMYYFEINDQSNSSYGGLESVHLTRNSVTANLLPETAEKFGNEDLKEVQVEFDIDDALYDDVLKTMKAIFEGHNILTVS